MAGKKESGKGAAIFAFVDDYQTLRGVVGAGADNVCIDLLRFPIEEKYVYDLSMLEHAVAYAKVYQKKVYASLAIVIKNSEINFMLERISGAVSAGIDGLIIADVSLLPLLKSTYPDLEVIVSDRHPMANSLAVEMQSSADAVILPKELTREEIVRILRKVDTPVILNAYKKSCFSYDGRCLMGSFYNGKSANRGKCSTLCRKPASRKAGMSGRDLCLIDYMQDMNEMGISGVALDFYGKTAFFAQKMTAAFARTIEQGRPLPEDLIMVSLLLAGGYSTSGFMKSRRRSMDRGVLAGTVSGGILRLDEPLRKGDTVRIDAGRRGNTHKINYMLKDGRKVASADEGEEIKLDFTAFKDGSRVWKIAIADGEMEEYRHPLSFRLSLRIGSNPVLMVDAGDISFSVEADKPVQRAVKSPLSKEVAVENLTRISNTPYKVDKVEIDMDDDAIIPYSELNKLKRDLLGKLIGRSLTRKSLGKIQVSITPSRQGGGDPRLLVHVKDMDGVIEAKEAGADLVYYDIFKHDVSEVVEYGKREGFPIYLTTPKMIHENGLAHIIKLIEHYEPEGILVSDSALLTERLSMQKHLDYTFSITNDLALKFWRSRAVISPELNITELANFQDKDFILFSHGRLTLMTSKKELRGPERLQIKGERYDVVKDPYGLTHLVSARPISLIEHVKDLFDLGIKQFMLSVDEDVAETVQRYRQALAGKGARRFPSTTTGHLHKGII
jgi:putative protease